MTEGRPARGPHLDHRLSALVDGELGHDDRDRCLAHTAECPSCLAALDAERRGKARVAALGPPEVPEGLTARLLAIADPPAAPAARSAQAAPAVLRAGRRTPPSLLPALLQVPSLPGRPGALTGVRPAGRTDAPGPSGAGGPGGPGRARRPLGTPLRRATATAGGLVVAASATLGVALLTGTSVTGAGGAGGGPGGPPVSALTAAQPGSGQGAQGGAARAGRGALRGGVVGLPCSSVTGTVGTVALRAPAGLPQCVQRPVAAPPWVAPPAGLTGPVLVSTASAGALAVAPGR